MGKPTIDQFIEVARDLKGDAYFTFGQKQAIGDETEQRIAQRNVIVYEIIFETLTAIKARFQL